MADRLLRSRRLSGLASDPDYLVLVERDHGHTPFVVWRCTTADGMGDRDHGSYCRTQAEAHSAFDRRLRSLSTPPF